jgi:hypothetical protein
VSTNHLYLSKIGRFHLIRIAGAIAIAAMTTISADAAPSRIFAGPANPGAETGFNNWMYGVLGTGSVALDTDNTAHGHGDFVIGVTNGTVEGEVNHADLRSEKFPLPYGGNTRGPLTFSFAYKLPGPVKPGDNLEVYLRFFAPGEEVFLGQKIFPVGSSTRDSEMSQYRTMIITNIFAPRKTVQADVWVVANIIKPWTSGYAYFDDFSVTAPAPGHWAKILIWAGIGAGAILLTMVLRRISRKRS